MDKQLQDRTWSTLPKEFKEEVEKYYDNSPALGAEAVLLLENLFGIHNLTSDAKREEMLCVSKKRVQDAFNSAKIIGSSKMSSKMLAGAADMVINTLTDLFGSKCLPDEEPLSQNPAENYYTESHISTDCDKPAQPKFKVGDKVTYKKTNKQMVVNQRS